MSETVSPRWERLSGFFVLFKQCFLLPHHMSSSTLGPLQASGWALLMAAAAITKGKLFVQFTQVQAGSTSAIQAFRKTDFWLGRRAMLLVILKTAVAAVVQEFAAGRLKILWRKVAAASAIRGYLDRSNTFYQLKLSGTVENPDARITADVAAIVDYSVDLSKVLPEHLWKFVGLTGVMWNVSPIACLLLWLYALGGTLLTRNGFEKRLSWHEAKITAIEAHIRYALVRIGECAEGIAFHGAGEVEQQRLLRGLDSLAVAQRGRLAWTSAFAAFQEVYGRVATMLPSLITAPLFWQHIVEFGDISKMFTAYRSTKETLLFASSNYDKLAFVGARLDRLSALRQFPALWALQLRPKIVMHSEAAPNTLLLLKSLRVAVPGSTTRRWIGGAEGVTLQLAAGDTVLLRGESGVGKSSLLRAIAGLWDEGSGEIHRQSDQSVFFVPQSAYLPAGECGAASSLRSQLLYPDSVASDIYLIRVLNDLNLHRLAPQLDHEQEWAAVLSGGEKQRIVIARLLVGLRGKQSAVVLLDEATSACSEAMEAAVYTHLLSVLEAAGGALVSVGHRSSLRRFHTLELTLEKEPDDALVTQMLTGLPAPPGPAMVKSPRKDV